MYVYMNVMYAWPNLWTQLDQTFRDCGAGAENGMAIIN